MHPRWDLVRLFLMTRYSIKRHLAGFILLFWLATPLTVHAITPMEAVKTEVDAVVDVLRNPALQGEKGRNVKQEKIKASAAKLFDFVELSKRSLGLYWNRFNPDERKEFVSLYTTLLEDVYVDKITAYRDEKIDFTKEVPLSERIVEVQTVVVTKTGNVHIDYQVIDEDGQWKVFDVVIEGVSLVENYRTQFREIMADNSPEGLLEILRKKVGSGDAGAVPVSGQNQGG